jgi:hypothetical protein
MTLRLAVEFALAYDAPQVDPVEVKTKLNYLVQNIIAVKFRRFNLVDINFRDDIFTLLIEVKRNVSLYTLRRFLAFITKKIEAHMPYLTYRKVDFAERWTKRLNVLYEQANTSNNNSDVGELILKLYREFPYMFKQDNEEYRATFSLDNVSWVFVVSTFIVPYQAVYKNGVLYWSNAPFAPDDKKTKVRESEVRNIINKIMEDSVHLKLNESYSIAQVEEWAQNIAYNYNAGINTDLQAQLQEACDDLGISFLEVERRLDYFTVPSELDWKDVYYLLTGVRR